MDPLSDVLSLLKPRSYVSAGFDAGGDWSLRFSNQQPFIKCYAVVSGQCWLSVDGVADAVRLKSGDCFVLPSGRPFRLASDMALAPVDASTIFPPAREGGIVSYNGGGDFFLVGSRFAVTGNHIGMLLGMLPPIVHIRRETDQAALRWSVERMMLELHERQPGSSLIAQHLAHMMLVQALRLHLADEVRDGVGWFFALADKQLGAAINAIRRSGASLDITDAGGTRLHVAIDLRRKIQRESRRDTHGIPDALANAAGGGPADQLQRSHFRHRPVARLRIRKRLQHGLQAGHRLFAPAT